MCHPALRQEQRQVVLDRLLRQERQPPGNRWPLLAVEGGLDFALEQRHRRLDLSSSKPVPDRRVGQRGRFEPCRGTSVEAGEGLRRLLALQAPQQRLPKEEVEFEPVAAVARRGAAQIGREGEAQRIPRGRPRLVPTGQRRDEGSREGFR